MPIRFTFLRVFISSQRPLLDEIKIAKSSCKDALDFSRTFPVRHYNSLSHPTMLIIIN
jgi:hypothetical protein